MAPESSLDPMLIQRGESPLGGLSEGPGLGRSSDNLIRQRKQEVARQMAARLHACLTDNGEVEGGASEERGRTGEVGEERGRTGEVGEKERGGQDKKYPKVLGFRSNRTEQRKHGKRRFKLCRQKRRKKRDLIQSAEFDRVGPKDYIDSSSSSDEDGDCFTNEVGGVISAEGREFRSLLLFIPLRLGQERFNTEYKEAVKVLDMYCMPVWGRG